MKVDSITFGRTFISRSLINLPKQNRQKLAYIYELGYRYPYDIYLDATKKGDLKIHIQKLSPWAYACQSGLLNFNDKSFLISADFALAMETIGKSLHPSLYPIERTIIKNLDKMNNSELYIKLQSELNRYDQKNVKKLNNLSC